MTLRTMVEMRAREHLTAITDSACRRQRRGRGVGGVQGRKQKRSIDAVVEIGGSSSLGVQQEASYELLLNLLPRLPADAERRPWKRRKSLRRE
jgi:hypothetical protein